MLKLTSINLKCKLQNTILLDIFIDFILISFTATVI